MSNSATDHAETQVEVPDHSIWSDSTEKQALFRKTLGIAAAAHELKTPLSVLSGYIKILLDESLGPLNEQQRRIALEIDAGATRLQRFVHDFLAFGAMESGKFMPQSKRQDVNAMLREVVDLWRGRFENRGISLVFLPGTDLPEVPFDELKMQHVVSNLLDNALKFTPKSGTVTITTRGYFWERRLPSRPQYGKNERRASASRKDNSVRVDVRDTGSGIPPEHHQEIFADFHRLSTSNNAEGAGLGLAIAKRLIEAHSGKIWIESNRDAGAMFSFLLPVC